jgi:hypothetical protein
MVLLVDIGTKSHTGGLSLSLSVSLSPDLLMFHDDGIVKHESNLTSILSLATPGDLPDQGSPSVSVSCCFTKFT